MNELVIIQRKEALTTSLKVAEAFGKRHDHVIRDIEAIILELENIESSLGGLPKFGESYYFNAQNKKQKMYKLNRQAFTLLAKRDGVALSDSVPNKNWVSYLLNTL